MAPVTTFSVGDRAIHTNLMYGTRSICTLEKIHDPVECGGVFKGEVDTPVTVKFGGSLTTSKTTLSKLEPYQTPKYPPGVHIPPHLYGEGTLDEMKEVESFMVDIGVTDEEKKILKELNDNDLVSITTGEWRDVALLGIEDKDMEEFEDMCNMKENYHRLIAASPCGGRWEDGDMPSYRDTGGNKLRKRNQISDGSPELDSRDRIIADVKITKKGDNYITGETDYGKVYFDLKYTRYIPEIGDKVKCVLSLKGPIMNLPWKCQRVIVQ